MSCLELVKNDFVFWGLSNMMTHKKMIIKGEVLSEILERCTNAAQISDRTTYVVAPESQCEDYSHQNNRQLLPNKCVFGDD